jgi:hypothetical protein
MKSSGGQIIRYYASALSLVRDESKQSLFNLTKIYQQIDYNDSMITGQMVTRGNFHWKNGEKDSEVVWTPEKGGRFFVSWFPDKPNNVININGKRKPGNEHMGTFGCDPYDISGAVGGRGDWAEKLPE